MTAMFSHRASMSSREPSSPNLPSAPDVPGHHGSGTDGGCHLRSAAPVPCRFNQQDLGEWGDLEVGGCPSRP